MFRSPRYFFVILALATATAQPNYAQDKYQDKAKDPKVVVDLEKSSPAIDAKRKKQPAPMAARICPTRRPSAKRAVHSARPRTATAISTAPFRSLNYSARQSRSSPSVAWAPARKNRPRRTPQAHPRCAERTNHGSFPLRGLGRMGAPRHRHHHPVLRPHQGRPGRIRRPRLLFRLRRHSLVAKNSCHAKTIVVSRSTSGSTSSSERRR